MHALDTINIGTSIDSLSELLDEFAHLQIVSVWNPDVWRIYANGLVHEWLIDAI